MKFTEYFVRHKVASIILNMMILIIGFLCLKNISVREYPNVEIPILSVRTIYPGASSPVVESSVTSVLEDAISGVSGIKYLVSSSQQNVSSITITFLDGIKIDKAMIELQNALNNAAGNMPKDAKIPQISQGSGSSGAPFFALALSSTEMEFGELAHYTTRYIKNNFRSINGVASADVWAPPYTMRVTLDPKKLYAYGINVSDVLAALGKYNVSLAVGQFQNDIPSTLDVDLNNPEDFENTSILTKNGRTIYLKDVSTTKLDTDGTTFRIHVDGKTGVAIGIEKASDANPIDVGMEIRKEVEKLQKTLPAHMKISIAIDSSQFISASLDNIYHSIFEAIILVLIIVYIFLRNIRATIIPLVTIPFSLLGSIAIMQAFGMSINTLTLLAMVLAIGLVVDDAIVMLENITRHIEEGMKPFDAAIKGASEIGFAIVAMTLTLASVYAPIAFIQGMVGQLFIEFAVALAGSVVISGIVALTLSPMMCSRILKSSHEDKESFMYKFLIKVDQKYSSVLHNILEKPKLIISIILGSIIASYVFIKLMPHEIVPAEDRGMIIVSIPSIAGANMDGMEAIAYKVENIAKTVPEGLEILTFLGQWGSATCVPLKDFKERKRHQTDIVNAVDKLIKELPSVDAYTSGWDSGLPGMDASSGGSNLTLVVSTIGEYEELSEYADKMIKKMTDSGKFMYVHHNIKFDTEGFDIILDRNKMANLQIDPQPVSDSISAFFSGNQNLQFKKDDVLYNITVDGIASPWSLDEIYINNGAGLRLSIGSFASLKETVAIAKLPHYNQMRAASISGALLPFVSIESVMPLVMKLAEETFPPAYKKEWTGAAEVATETSGAVGLMFIMAIIFIYSILAVQFDNFLDPFIIMITVPLACSGALFASWLLGQSLNIYTQIGLITLVGLITKHGILIVEFANKMLPEQFDRRIIETSVTKAAIIRLRPILMTTGAMVLGSVPLIISSGAGCEARQAIGIVLAGGLSFGTFFTLFVLPKIYCWVKGFTIDSIKPLKNI